MRVPAATIVEGGSFSRDLLFSAWLARGRAYYDLGRRVLGKNRSHPSLPGSVFLMTTTPAPPLTVYITPHLLYTYSGTGTAFFVAQTHYFVLASFYTAWRPLSAPKDISA